MRVPGFPFVQAAGSYTDRDDRHYGFAIHATANTATDTAEASYASHREDGTSAHLYVDADSATQALDTDRKAGHAGSAYGNENAIAIEITGLNGWSRERWLTSVAWDRLAQWLAYVIVNDPDYAGFEVRWATPAEMRANPRVQAFYTHDDMRVAWGNTDHTDPGPNFPKDRLIRAVETALQGYQEDEDMGASFGPIEIKEQGGTSLCIPPVKSGIADPRPCWLNFCNDSFDRPYALRIWMTKGDGRWAAFKGPGIDADGVLTLNSGQRFSHEIPAGVACISITRVEGTFLGHLTCCIERG